jgi:hypothetical protein
LEEEESVSSGGINCLASVRPGVQPPVPQGKKIKEIKGTVSLYWI